MKIALFGGAFNPPHLGHHQVIKGLLQSHEVDEVWLVPARKHPFSKNLAADSDRLAMCELAVQPFIQDSPTQQKVRVETFELDHDQVSYSLITLDFLSKKYPEHTFCWVIGADNITSFSKWYHADELLKRYKVLVYPRIGYSTDELLPGMKLVANMKAIGTSSTQVRTALQEKKPITDLVLPEVMRYAMGRQMYQLDSHSNTRM